MKQTASKKFLQLISEAQHLIHGAKEAKKSIAQRCDSAIDLAALMLKAAQIIQTKEEADMQAQLFRMMQDPAGKTFTTAMTDQCFRSRDPKRIADQICYLLSKYGIPRFLSCPKRWQMRLFRLCGKPLAHQLVPLVKHMLRKATETVILPGEPAELTRHLQMRKQEEVLVNLNHLGEAILGEAEAKKRLNTYLQDLQNPDIEYISVKISTIFSQINLLAWEASLQILSERLRLLYRAAMANPYIRPDGSTAPKFVNLDMEEYRDLNLTVDLFQQVLGEAEFRGHAAGIVLQSYLPDSFAVQQKLTEWAMRRYLNGGAPIKIRLVKGANLAMEKVEASLRGWPQAPYPEKCDVDANFKRMVTYACMQEHAKAVHVGIASHNLFDIAYAMLLRVENGVDSYVSFEMLEGMADHIRRVVQSVTGQVLLYCPVAEASEFQNAVAYLIRRLDENTAPQNFLRHLFGLNPETDAWKQQSKLFRHACQHMDNVGSFPRRVQNRALDFALEAEHSKDRHKDVSCEAQNAPFKNEPDTDWSLSHNRTWAEAIMSNWQNKAIADIPLMLGPSTLEVSPLSTGHDPSHPTKVLYRYSLGDKEHAAKAIEIAKNAHLPWSALGVAHRAEALRRVANALRRKRADLLGAMIFSTGKTIYEADVEVSEAIDFAEYYAKNVEDWLSLPDIHWQSKGVVLVASPWNFPCSIPAGGISAALAAGNSVIFKPAPEAVLVGWVLVQAFWEAGISHEVLQFFNCLDDPTGSWLIQNADIQAIILTGATATAKHFLSLKPGIDLLAETGGKNALIITAMADRDLAIKDLIHSAFGHAGQKCSACSLAICEAEVYDDPHFRQQLLDAVDSLKCGEAGDFQTRLNPLIQAPSSHLKRALTTLEPQEFWLLKPVQDVHNPQLWSPGLKMGVQSGSFTHQTELFGPVLGIMRANNLSHAVKLANGTPYGLTSGLHSLDEREQHYWLKHIKTGNAYINRSITGAIVQRQPFGGCKESSFGMGFKAGGPNYLAQLMLPSQRELPEHEAVFNPDIKIMDAFVLSLKWDNEQILTWTKSIKSYMYYWQNYFRRAHDPSNILGQSNILRYLPKEDLSLRVQPLDAEVDIMRSIAAALICHAHLEISIDPHVKLNIGQFVGKVPYIHLVCEAEEVLIHRLKGKTKKIKRMRFLSSPSSALLQALASTSCTIDLNPVMANGRVELLHYLREMSISTDYHRYGNIPEVSS